MENSERIYYLLKQRLNTRLTNAEKDELAIIIQNDKYEATVVAMLELLLEKPDANAVTDTSGWDERIQSILSIDKAHSSYNVINVQQQGTAHKLHFFKKYWIRYAAAAIFIILTSTALTFLLPKNGKRAIATLSIEKNVPQPILPGGNKAVLKLSNGKTIILDSAANGSLALQGNVKVVKLANGQIVYSTDGKAASEALYNTMSTPRGGQYKLTLSDGTVVWLNSSSAITYPISFTGKERNVTIEGEAYFEVAKDRSKPFHVKIKDVDVAVLGTHFNINSYEDEENLKTTLLEGSIKITNGAATTAVLKPGQQAVVALSNQLEKSYSTIEINNNVDVEQVMAWKNGFFQFNGYGIRAVMRQLERWYDINVRYEGKIAEREFAGQINRNATLSEVLSILKESNVHFKIEGRNLIITP